MPYEFASRVTSIDARDWPDAAAGTIHDPLWMLTRQWQVGEFQGENAASPVKAVLTTTTRVISAADGPSDMRDLPPEVLVESEDDGWWTLGRRLQHGRLIAEHLGLKSTDSRWLIASVPPPYDQVSPAWDGLAMWRSTDLTIPAAVRPPVPEEPKSAWVAEQLVYDKESAFTADGAILHVRRHLGGRMDWYSVDADLVGDAPAPEEQSPVIPVAMEYPGMPRTGVWEIEDVKTDIAGLAPDSAHTATAMVMALFFAHRDEWFDVPVPGEAGSIVRIVNIAVTDSFGETYIGGVDREGTPHGPLGLRHPEQLVATAAGDLEWGVFRTVGLAAGELILWQTAERPVEGSVVERVQFGVDDQSDVVWAVERRIAEREPQPAPPVKAESIVPLPPGDLAVAQAYHYVPGSGGAAHWIPYTMSSTGPRMLRQRRLLDLTRYPAPLFPEAEADVLSGHGKSIAESVIPLGGLEVERRWMLARSATGAPLLWIQRRRAPLMSAPARTLRFDIAAPTSPPVD